MEARIVILQALLEMLRVQAEMISKIFEVANSIREARKDAK